MLLTAALGNGSRMVGGMRVRRAQSSYMHAHSSINRCCTDFRSVLVCTCVCVVCVSMVLGFVAMVRFIALVSNVQEQHLRSISDTTRALS